MRRANKPSFPQVFSTNLPTHLQQHHNVFDPSKSTTFQPAAAKNAWRSMQQQHGSDAEDTVTAGTDTLDLGGLKVENQAVELAPPLGATAAAGTGDGVLGLACTITTPVAAHMMQQQGDMPKQEAQAQLFFTSAMGGDDTEPFYTFGYIDTDLVPADGEIHWTTMVENNSSSSHKILWTFPSATASVDGEVVVVTPPAGGNNSNMAIADTTTPLALVADEVCERLYGAIPGARYSARHQGWVFPDPDHLPEFKVAVGDRMFAVRKQDLAFAPADEHDRGTTTTTTWYGAVQSRGDNPFDVLGLVFLKGVYAVWDRRGGRFGCVARGEGREEEEDAAC